MTSVGNSSVDIVTWSLTWMSPVLTLVSVTEWLTLITVFLGTILLQDALINSPSLPGPWFNLPLLGYLPWLGSKPYQTLWRLSIRFGPVYQLRFGSRQVVVLNGRETIRSAFLSHGDSFSGRPDFPSFKSFCCGNSIAFGQYDQAWSAHRRLAAKALAAFINNDRYPIDSVICRSANQLADKFLDKSAKVGGPIDPYQLIEQAVVDVLYEICFGQTFNLDSNGSDAESDKDLSQDRDPGQDKNPSQGGDIYREMMDNLHGYRRVLPIVQNVDVMPWTSTLFRSQLRRYGDCLERFDSLTNEKVDALVDSSNTDERCLTLALDQVLKCAKKRSDAEHGQQTSLPERRRLLSTVQDVVGAGTDTVVHFVHWFIAYVTKFPYVQHRIRAEIQATIGTDPATRVSGADHSQMPFTEATMWEVARHSAVAPMSLPHQAIRDVILDGGVRVPAGTTVFANFYSTGWDPSEWDDPKQFRPERFLVEQDGGVISVDQNTVDKLICFGVGRRRCLGERLGRLIMFIFMVVLLDACQFEQIAGQELTLENQFTLTNRAKTFYVRVKPNNSSD